MGTENKNHDPNYRNDDYQTHQITEDDIVLTSKLLSLYARTNLETDDLGKLLIRGSSDQVTDLDRRVEIGNAVGKFFDSCRAMAMDDRIVRRCAQTAMDVNTLRQRDIAAFQQGVADHAAPDTLERMRPKELDYYIGKEVTYNRTADVETAAHGAISELVTTLRANFANDALDPDTLQTMTGGTFQREALSSNGILFGRNYGSGQMNERDRNPGSAYTLMIGIAKTIESYDAERLSAEMNAIGGQGIATKLLFQKETDSRFKKAAVQMGMQERSQVEVPGE